MDEQGYFRIVGRLKVCQPSLFPRRSPPLSDEHEVDLIRAWERVGELLGVIR